MESGHDVEREALQFERDIERDEIVGGDHHHHADGREQHQHGVFRPRDAFALVEAHCHDEGQRRADQHQHLRESAETVDHKEAVERDLALGSVGMQRRSDEGEGDDQRRNREPGDLTRGLVALEGAEDEERERRCGEENLGQRSHEIGKREMHERSPYRAAKRWPVSRADCTLSIRLPIVGCSGRRKVSG